MPAPGLPRIPMGRRAIDEDLQRYRLEHAHSESHGALALVKPLAHEAFVAEFMDWDSFQSYWPSIFKQGEHVTIIGPTGSGKTLLGAELVKPRKWVVAAGIKAHDKSMERLQRAGWQRVGKWKDKGSGNTRVLLWPKKAKIHEVKGIHRRVFAEMLGDVWTKGGWCVWTDELRYMTDLIRLKEPYVLMYVTARSNNVSLVSSAQRPSHVPLEAYSQAQHLFLFRTGDERDLVRMGGLNGVNAREVARIVAQLPKHHFLHVNLNDGSYQTSTLKGNFK